MAADADRKVVLLDERILELADTALPVQQPLPGAFRVGCQGSRHGDAGDDHVGEPVPRSQPCSLLLRWFLSLNAQYRPKARATLCPPNPNELLMAYWYSPYRGSPATTSRSISGIGCLVVQCRRDDAIAQRQHRQHRLERADRTDGVAERRLRRVHRGVLHTGDPDGVGLGGVTDRGGRGVGVDVAGCPWGPGPRSPSHASSPGRRADRRRPAPPCGRRPT